MPSGAEWRALRAIGGRPAGPERWSTEQEVERRATRFAAAVLLVLAVAAGVCGIATLSLPPVIAGIVLAVLGELGLHAGRNPRG